MLFHFIRELARAHTIGLSICVAAVSLAGFASAQTCVSSDGNLSAPAVVPYGGSFEVQVASAGATVGITLGGPAVSLHPVGSDHRAVIPVPAEARPGMVMAIFVGRGLRASVLLVEVVDP